MNEISKLRTLLQKNAVDAYLVPMRDEWGCEYVPAQNRRLEYITGFTGSSGFAVIAKDKAAFFTDGRYTLQAAMEVDEGEFEIFDQSEKTDGEWLQENFKKNSKIGYDAKLFSVLRIKNLKECLDEKGIKLVELEKNLIDEIWDKRPAPVETKAFVLDKKFSGTTAGEKIKQITAKMKGDYMLITSAESICWLLNIRANDLDHTPVLLCYAILNKKGEVYIYGNSKALQKIEDKIKADVFTRDVKEISTDLKLYKDKKIELDPAITPMRFKNILEKHQAEIIETHDICLEGRSIKNEAEIEGLRAAHIRDGVAMVKFLFWLESNARKGQDEISVANRLEEFRRENDNYFSLSFDTIAGWNANGAIVHYRASEESKAAIKGDGILLLDSGAQYFDGTTDITRTIAVGKVSAEQKKNFTLVLKGHIAIARQKFLKGASGCNLDVLARQFLWNEGLDFKHGTGHGVGYFLNVHEGPHGITRINNVPLKAGMVISNEPGYYKQGEYGIRIESLVLVNEAEVNGFYEFETLTKAPIDRTLIDKKMLDKQETDWLDNYHEDIYKCVAPLLNKEEKEWLKKATEKL